MARSADPNEFSPPSSQNPNSLPPDATASLSGGARSDRRILHVLNRLGFGPRPGDVSAVQRMGLDRYIEQQLNPASIPLPSWLRNELNNATTLRGNAVDLYQNHHPRQVRIKNLNASQRRLFNTPNSGKLTKQERQIRRRSQSKALEAARRRESRQQKNRIREQVQLPALEASKARLLRAINSPRQFEEVMVNFWFNHFNVSRRKGFVRTWVGIYDEQAIRPHVLGSFRDMLGATARHPAMLFYLDNFRSKADGINENYARELLELHTLGVDGGYTLQDIQEVARVFTGWTFPRLERSVPLRRRQTSGFRFDQRAHDYGTKRILGQTIQGSGELEGEQVLDLLTRHPSTAKHISYKLAQYFVADEPPSTLVNAMAQSFQSSRGNISAVIRTMLRSQEFWNPQYFSQKFKTPYEYLVSAYRATGQTNIDTRQFLGKLDQLGMPLYGCETPDGYDNVRSAWLSPEGMLRRISYATAIAKGRVESNQTVNPTQLAQTLGYAFSPQTLQVLQNSPRALQASGILGSPEMMMR